MSASNRIPGKGRLSPAKPVSFTFDGKPLTALEGDTLASALLANGIHLVGRSFKYHRPRGILGSGPEEPNALMDISRDKARSQPNVRATVQEVFEGMVAKSQNRWPSLEMDIGAINNSLSRFFPAGFYYKTFKWPRSAWEKLYEPIIRKAAGLGVAPQEPDPDSYANRFAHCDVLVVGSGAAGLAAALAAAQAGKNVILCDENPSFGGSLLSETRTVIDKMPATQWVEKTLGELQSLPNVTLLNRTTAFGYYAQNMVALSERITDHLPSPEPENSRERLWQVRATKVIIAQGAIARHMVFPDNDRPGILLAGAAQTFLNKYSVTVGQNVGVYTACDSAYAATFDLAEEGINIPVIVDHREGVSKELQKQADEFGIRIITAAYVSGTTGKLRVNGMSVTRHTGGTPEDFEVDALITSAGWTPSLHLYSQSRCKPQWDETR
ncbi:MAG: 2Fe-2S iron-sulfur cluster-binding protein, partial [Devosiaceae bacterium]|nr:2Fe-2S iron-sulfur cluster-binding protein [Devosiaceae bacterium]